MASSRIFVRGLPPSLSDSDFKQHFAAAGSVTDAKLLAKRRIGFVGFKTEQEAARAVKFFNKSFIRMSRLGVELAQSTEEASHHVDRSNLSQDPSQITSSRRSSDTLKRKRNSEDEAGQSRSSPAKQKTSKRDVPGTVRQSPTVDASTLGDPSLIEKLSVSGQSDKSASQFEAAVQDQTGTGQSLTHSSDSDWMRMRTSRLLELVDETDNGKADFDQSRHERDLGPHDQANTQQFDQNEGEDNAETFSSRHNSPGKDAEADQGHDAKQDSAAAEEAILKSGRLFIRNLAYAVSEEEISNIFKPFGSQEVYMPRDYRSGAPKGIGFVQYENTNNAVAAFKNLDGTIFQGRLLHVIPAESKRGSTIDETTLQQLPVKKRKAIQKKTEAMSSMFSWNSLFMNADAVMSSTAARLGIPKSQLLDPTSADAAVKQAQMETHTIQETRKYFESHGVDLTSFGKRERNGSALLVKNFKYDTNSEDLKNLFAQQGEVVRVVMPPSGTIAIIEFASEVQARAAFGAMAYRKYKDSVLFLERAPRDIFNVQASIDTQKDQIVRDPKMTAKGLIQDEEEIQAIDTATLYVRNLSFSTSSERLSEVFGKFDGFISGIVKTKPNPKDRAHPLSMGFGFLEFRSATQAKAAFLAMHGHNLDGHELVIRASHKGLDAAAQRRKDDNAKKEKTRKTKIIVKNLPFEASKQDVRNLFKTYGQLRAVRVPKKFDSSQKGFAFAEFATPREAESAMDALRSTHLLGRRLVLEYAAGDVQDPEQEIEKMQKKVERQSDNIAIHQISKTQRKRLQFGNSNKVDEGV